MYSTPVKQEAQANLNAVLSSLIKPEPFNAAFKPELHGSKSEVKGQNAASSSTTPAPLTSDQLRIQWVMNALQQRLRAAAHQPAISSSATDVASSKNYNTLVQQLQTSSTALSKAMKDASEKSRSAKLQKSNTQQSITATAATAATTTMQHSMAQYRWLSALSRCSSLIHPTACSALVQQLLGFDYRGQSVQTVHAFTQLMINTITAQPTMLNQLLRPLVRSFLAQNVVMDLNEVLTTSGSTVRESNDDGTATVKIEHTAMPDMTPEQAKQEQTSSTTTSPSTDESTVASIDDIHDLVHTAIHRLTKLMPSAVAILFQLLIELYPHRRLDSIIQQIYVKNLLRIGEYIPSLRDRVLTIVIEKMIHLDVEVIADVENQLKGESSDQGTTESKEHELESTFPLQEAEDYSRSKVMADKLDAIMSLLFEYLQLIKHTSQNTSIYTSGAANASTSRLDDSIFTALLRVFERSILRTHKSRFTQFLVFYYCSIKHTYSEQFLQWLLEKSYDTRSALIDRTSAASYIASFVARAKFLRHASAIAIFDALVVWLHQYVDQFESLTPDQRYSSDSTEHTQFYCLCQTALYIFCYRQQSFIQAYDKDIDQMKQRYQLETIVHSELNPLRYCNTHIVKEFARVTAELDYIVNCYPVMQHNARYAAVEQNQMMEAGLSTGVDNTTSTTTTEIFFPFDPYQLKHSSVYLNDLYNAYITYNADIKYDLDDEEEEMDDAVEVVDVDSDDSSSSSSEDDDNMSDSGDSSDSSSSSEEELDSNELLTASTIGRADDVANQVPNVFTTARTNSVISNGASHKRKIPVHDPATTEYQRRVSPRNRVKHASASSEDLERKEGEDSESSSSDASDDDAESGTEVASVSSTLTHMSFNPITGSPHIASLSESEMTSPALSSNHTSPNMRGKFGTTPVFSGSSAYSPLVSHAQRSGRSTATFSPLVTTQLSSSPPATSIGYNSSSSSDHDSDIDSPANDSSSDDEDDKPIAALSFMQQTRHRPLRSS